MNKIFIKNYVLVSKHGYYKEEHYKPQRFIVSVSCDVRDNNSGASDDLKSTFNYENIRSVIDEVIMGDSKKLLEHLSEIIAAQILEHKIVESVEVEIRKPDIWTDCEAGVLIIRKQN